MVATGDKVEVIILDFDMQKRRLSLGMKQAISNPWDKIKNSLQVDKIHEGEITNITEFGLFIKINDDIESILLEDDDVDDESEINETSDELYNEAVQIVKETKKTSISFLQRKLKIGYNRAANLIEAMESQGILSEPQSNGNREIL